MQRETTFRYRRPRLEDAPAVETIVNECVIDEVDMAFYRPGQLVREWTADAAAADMFEVVEEGEEIVGVLECHRDAAKRELYFEVFVKPAARGSEVGDLLVDRAEERASLLARDLGSAVNIEANGGPLVDDLLMKRGYERRGCDIGMFLDLDTPPPKPEWTNDTRLRAFVEGRDERLMYDSLEAFFGSDWPVTSGRDAWIEAHQTSEDYDPYLWWFAERGREVVGAVEGKTSWHGADDTGWLKNLAVREDARRLGIGRVLLLHVAGIFHERGKRQMVLGVFTDNPTNAIDFYERVGMRRGPGSFDYRKSITVE